jgi:SAM-dependent methyltransferase
VEAVGGLVCRLCGAPLSRTFVDLGSSPPCETFLLESQLDEPEVFYPLHARTCSSCLLVQLPAEVAPEAIFDDYAYFSSYSDSWVEHARSYVVQRVEQLGLGPDSLVVEVASNDGYLLQHLVALGVPVLGIEPASNVARAAQDRGVRTHVAFLGRDTAAAVVAEHGPADLVVGNNVFAHVPDLDDFTAGLRTLLADDGLLTLEFPHLLRLVEQVQYDTIYHEHFSYFTLLTASRALARHGLSVVDVEQLRSHGGSLRLHVRVGDALPVSAQVEQVLADEAAAGLHSVEGHDGFGPRVERSRQELLQFLLRAAREGKRVAGYGAPGKGNTLLNYCGVRSDLLVCTVDRNPYKHGRYLPGTHIPVHPVEHLEQLRPDYVLVLPWNLREEISAQLEHVRRWGAQLVVAVPQLEVW